SLEPIFLDDIPEPIKVLDDIISEFEEATAKPVAFHSNSGENQSEDDGYMSLSRKNMSKKDSEDVPQTPSTDTVPEDSFNEVDGTAENLSKLSEAEQSQEATFKLIQTTLPKARTSNSTPSSNSKYSSLPCCGAKTSNLNVGSLKNSNLFGSNQAGSCNGERNALGIDISAVHNAVLRGNLAKLPEPFLNEHPVTIYPGPSAKASGENARGHRLLNSVEKHKEVCIMLNPHSTSSSGSQNTSSGEASPAASNNNVATSKHLQVQDDYSENSLEESTISTELTPVKQNSVAWEIHFKSNKKNPSQKAGYKEIDLPYFNNCLKYNEESMLGKGTFVIRRSIAKKSTHAADIFSVPKQSRIPQSAGAISNEFYNSDSELSESALLPQAPVSCDMNFIYKEGNATASQNRRCLESAATQRAALSLDIAEATEHLNIKPVKSKTAMLTEKRLSAESMPDNTSSSEEFDEARLNGFDLFSYNTNEQLISNSTTPHTDLAPTLEEDEELSDFSYGCAPLKQIEHNISALLRGDLPIISQNAPINGSNTPSVAPTTASSELQAKRLLEFRPSVHKSESAKEMLLSQSIGFGPLPPSPPSSNPDLFDYNAPLPPSPVEPHKTLDLPVSVACGVTAAAMANRGTTVVEVHATASGAAVHSNSQKRRSRENVASVRNFNDELPPPPTPAHQSTGFGEVLPGLSGLPIAPAVPPHRASHHSANTMKSWSIDSQYRKKSPKLFGYGSGSGITTPTGQMPSSISQPPNCDGGSVVGSGSYQRKYINYGTKRSLKQSPREEHRLQTSCSLPETPIFARGCDIPRTPYRRQNDPVPASGSRTAPRSSTSNSISMGNSILGIGAGAYGTAQICRQRSINHALASNEMLRMTGAPARGWYPKQRSMRPASTENIDRLASVRVWDNPIGMSGTGQSRKPLTLPPNLTPSFLNKSPREALRRVTSLLITKKKHNKDRKHKAYSEQPMDESNSQLAYEFENVSSKRKETNSRKDNASAVASVGTTPKAKKKGLFKTLWKRAKTASLDQ
ncbi:hypothetical protein KR093_002611, partial [Drosophila rubida]